jgi:hypothetical protein
MEIRAYLAILFGLFPPIAIGQDTVPQAVHSVRIAGTAIDACGDEVPNASVTLTLAGLTDAIATTQTDGGGTFLFTSVIPGAYELRLERGALNPVVAQADTSVGADVSLIVQLQDPLVCPTGSRPILYKSSPIPQSLDPLGPVVFADSFPWSPRSTTICEISKDPNSFKGKTVRLRGRVRAAFEDFELLASDCDGKKIDSVWLEYGKGPKEQPTTWCCGSTTSRDSLPVAQNRDFKRFYRYITAQRKGCHDVDCHLYEVTATLQGRLDSVPTMLCPDGKSQCPQSGGFGHFGLFSARLVIQSVSDVMASRIRK